MDSETDEYSFEFSKNQVYQDGRNRDIYNTVMSSIKRAKIELADLERKSKKYRKGHAMSYYKTLIECKMNEINSLVYRIRDKNKEN